MNKTLLYVLLAITFSILCLMANFTLNFSASEPLGFYRPTNEQLKRNRLVLLREPLKRLVGVPGDHIRTSPKGTYVNDKLVQNSGIPTDSPYRPYPYTTFVLEPYQYWTLGDNPLSWDSRYIGPVPDSLIASTVEPFITW